jgi:hypothetical protein
MIPAGLHLRCWSLLRPSWPTRRSEPFHANREGPQFILDGGPFYVAGVNNHYLPWGSDTEIERLLDDAVAMGANVVRTFLSAVIGPTIWKFHNDGLIAAISISTASISCTGTRPRTAWQSMPATCGAED